MPCHFTLEFFAAYTVRLLVPRSLFSLVAAFYCNLWHTLLFIRTLIFIFSISTVIKVAATGVCVAEFFVCVRNVFDRYSCVNFYDEFLRLMGWDILKSRTGFWQKIICGMGLLKEINSSKWTCLNLKSIATCSKSKLTLRPNLDEIQGKAAETEDHFWISFTNLRNIRLALYWTIGQSFMIASMIVWLAHALSIGICAVVNVLAKQIWHLISNC